MSNELTQLMKAVPGLGAAFEQSADYSRMAKVQVQVGNVNHKATIDVNKDGVEAAAATAISVVLYSNFQPEREIIIDRPFLYFIVENDESDAIHIAGILNSPKEVIL